MPVVVHPLGDLFLPLGREPNDRPAAERNKNSEREQVLLFWRAKWLLIDFHRIVKYRRRHRNLGA